MEIIDAKGLACPQPVILAKRKLEESCDVVVIVDNETAVQNVSRLGKKMDCEVNVEANGDGTFHVSLERQGGGVPQNDAVPVKNEGAEVKGHTVIAVTSRCMGSGDDELGALLMRSFLHTVTEMDELPGQVVLYNSGVQCALQGADTLEDLKALEEKGVEILVCGTCTNFYDVTEKVAVGIISNMYDILSAMAGAGRLIRP